MMKFACFEKTVEAIYTHVVPKPRADCSKSEQLMVTFAAGYIAGVFCAIVSHPADSVVSLINKDPSKSAGQSKLNLDDSFSSIQFVAKLKALTEA
jgi:solute carrier family 25 phosphate transporter 3